MMIISCRLLSLHLIACFADYFYYDERIIIVYSLSFPLIEKTGLPQMSRH